jgi:hypothetical protein
VCGSCPVVRPDRPLQFQEGDEAQRNVLGVPSTILMEALSDDVLDVHQKLCLTSMFEVEKEDPDEKQDVLRVLW